MFQCINKKENQYNINTNSPETVTSAESSRKPNYVELVDESAVEEYGDNYMFKKEAATPTETIITPVLKTLKQCNIKGVAEKDIIDIICNLTGKSIDELNKLSNSEIDRLTKLLTQTVEHMTKKGKEVNTKTLLQQAQDYQRVIKYGWGDVNEFEKAQDENNDSLITRLENSSGKCWNTLSDEEKIEEIKRYFNEYYKEQEESKFRKVRHLFKRAMGKTSGNYKEAVKIWMETDFSKLLYNTREEDRKLFIEAAKQLEGCDSANLFLDIFDSYKNQELKTEAANEVTTETTDEIARKSAKAGCGDENKNKEVMQTSVASSQSDDAVQRENEKALKSLEEFEVKYANELKEIYRKVQNSEELSDDEIKIKYEYEGKLANIAGRKNGFLKNHVASEQVIKEGIETLATAIQASYEAERINAETQQFIQDNKEDLRFTEEETQAILEEAGVPPMEQAQVKPKEQPSIGYAQTEQPKTSETTVSAPVQEAQTTQSSQEKTTGFGFSTTNNVDTQRLTNLTQIIKTQYAQDIKPTVVNKKDVKPETIAEIDVTKTTGIMKALQFGKEGVDKFFAENGTIKAVTAVFNNFSQINDKTIITRAIQLYKSLSSSEQSDILVCAKNGALVELINNSDASALAQCQGETASNFWATKKINEAAKKALEAQA